MNSPQPAPGSQTSLRESNRLRVLEMLRRQGAMTQVEIAAHTGLSPATVSNMVKELDAASAVELAPSIRNGRRAVLVSLSTGNTLLAGIAFGDRDVRVAVGTGPRDIGEPALPLPPDHHADEGMERASRLVHDLVEKAGKTMPDVRSVCIGLPAPVDSVSGQVGSEGILPGWRGSRWLRRWRSDCGRRSSSTTRPTSQHSASRSAVPCRGSGMACTSSCRTGWAPGSSSGELFRGSAGTAGEIGHLTIDENGPICRCGNRGCLETYIGGPAAGGAGDLARRDGAAGRHQPGPTATLAAGACSTTPGATSASRSPAW